MSEARSSAELNPYRSPGGSLASEEAADSGRPSKFEQLGRLMVTWEMLRMVYNLVGLVPTVLVVLVTQPPIIEVAFCAFLANLCYCLGPLIDGYVTWFGFRHRAVTVILFVLGTMSMLVLALGYAIGTMYAPF